MLKGAYKESNTELLERIIALENQIAGNDSDGDTDNPTPSEDCPQWKSLEW